MVKATAGKVKPQQTTVLTAQPTLADLAERINAEHDQAQAALRDGLLHARTAGDLLIQAKGLVRHGEWLPWLQEHCRVAERTAQAYMRVAREWEQLAKSATVADLTFREASRLLTHSPDDGAGGDAAAAAVEEGHMSVSTAAILASEPKEKQHAQLEEQYRCGRKYKAAPKPESEPEPAPGVLRGKGVALAHEAINCLIRIPKNDALRKRGFQIVMDWIKGHG
jgi:hypothetical protein